MGQAKRKAVKRPTADKVEALLKAAKAAAERMRGDGYGLVPDAVGAKELRDLEAAVKAAEGE